MVEWVRTTVAQKGHVHYPFHSITNFEFSRYYIFFYFLNWILNFTNFKLRLRTYC
jgi:hypothetical protein